MVKDDERNISIDVLRAGAIVIVIALHSVNAQLAAPTPTGLAPIADILVGFIATLGLAYVMAEITYHLYEAPTNRWLRAKLLDHRPPRDMTLPVAEPAPSRST